MKRIVFFFLSLIAYYSSIGQVKDSSSLRVISVDSVRAKKIPEDTAAKKRHSPRKATLRSAILPGWGQVYNRSYWKVPLVYAALGITGGVFNYNLKIYRKAKFAYFTLINKDSANFNNVAPELKIFVTNGDANALQQYRNDARKYVDYSVLYFILFWGLNVVDATVDGHLKEFDVSNDLSLKIKPVFNALPSTLGVSVVLTIGKNNSHKPLPAEVR